MDNDRVWILMAKQNAGEATLKETQELEELLSVHPVSEDAKKLLDSIWLAPVKSMQDEVKIQKLWERIESIIQKSGRVIPQFSQRFKWLVAASIILFVGTAALFVFDRNGKSEQTKLNNISTQAGSKSNIELPDGTQVWLNGNSRLTYNSSTFGEQNREVNLTGEAFFDVASNKKVPFIIHTSQLDILVTGTAFNVKAYPLSGIIETALVHGSIEITTPHIPDRKIYLKPNEKFVLALDSMELKKRKVTTPQDSFSSFSISKLVVTEGRGPVETVWMNNQLLFTDDKFEHLALKLESWYNIRIHFEDSELKDKRFSGVIEKETLEETLRLLQMSYPFKFRREMNDIWISSKKN